MVTELDKREPPRSLAGLVEKVAAEALTVGTAKVPLDAKYLNWPYEKAEPPYKASVERLLKDIPADRMPKLYHNKLARAIQSLINMDPVLNTKIVIVVTQEIDPSQVREIFFYRRDKLPPNERRPDVADAYIITRLVKK